MMNLKLVISSFIVLAFLTNYSIQQRNSNIDLQGLSYSNAGDLPPIRRTTSTTPIPETTTKKGFFSGLTNFFKKEKKEEVSTTTARAVTPTTTPVQRVQNTSPTSQRTTPTTTVPSTTASRVKVSTQISLVVPTTTVPSVTGPKGQSSLPTSQITTPSSRPTSSTAKTTGSGFLDQNNFPALPQRPGGNSQFPDQSNFPPLPQRPNAGRTTTRPSVTAPTSRNPWTGTSTPPSNRGSTGVNFVPHQRPQGEVTTKKPVYAAGDTASDAELMTLSETLFNRDINNAFKYVTVNYQGKTYSSATTDEALHPFLAIDDKLYQMSTVEKMKALFNNYELDTLTNEYVTPLERKEENEFLDAILATPVMRHAMVFLQQKGKVTADPQSHRELLKTIWFNLYSRGQGKIGSSGFEHVFLSELKNSTVIGLHNWIYFYDEEKAGNINYKGYNKKIDFGNKGALVKVRFSFKNIEKPTNSLFIGTSPELEMALYTVCFEMRADTDCPMAYGGNRFNMVTHTFRYRGKNLIGSAYPEIV